MVAEFRLSESAFKGALHCHSTTSDGVLSPEDVCRFYGKRGYSFVSVTDHNKLSRVSSKEITAIPGVEINTGKTSLGDTFHVVLVGVDEMPPVGVRDNPQDLIDWALENDVYVYLAHPHWSVLSMKDMLEFNRVFALEVYNHGSEVSIARGYSEQYWDYVLSSGFMINGLATDDAHVYTFDADGGWVVVNSNSRDADDILDALKRGDFYSSCGPVVKYAEASKDRLLVMCSPVRIVKFISYGDRGIVVSLDLLRALDKGMGLSWPIVDFHVDVVEPYTVYHLDVAERFRVVVKVDDGIQELSVSGSGIPLDRFVRVEVVDDLGRHAWVNPFTLD